MSQNFDGFRGRGRGFSEGGDMGRGGSGAGFHGGSFGYHGGGFHGGNRYFRGFRGGGDRGMSRGGFRSDHVSPRGFRGGDRGGLRGGDRGGLRGGDRGGLRGGDRGGGFVNRGRFYRGSGGVYRGSRSYRGGGRGGFRARSGLGGGRRDRGGLINQAMKEPVFQEIQDGLQLLVIYKEVPTLEEMKKQLPNFHSRIERPTGKDSTLTAYDLLFSDLESLETAKVKLDKDPNVEATDYMGMRSAKKRAEATENRKLFMKFSTFPDEDSVKELDSRIESVEFLKSTPGFLKSSTLLALFPSSEVATSAIELLMGKIGINGLLYVRESFGMKYQAAALAGTQRNQVVLRDVPKTTTLKDIVELFPDANNFVLYDKTFTSSTYCHASLRFKKAERATEILAMEEIKILGKKVYAFDAHCSLLQDFPQLDEIVPCEKAKASQEEGPSRATKKIKRRMPIWIELDKEDD